VTEDGRLFVWGSGKDAALGLGDREDRLLPEAMDADRIGGQRVFMAVCGDSHSFALTDAGELWAWGKGDNGRLGLGADGNRLRPERVHGFAGEQVAMMAAGTHHSAAVTRQGHLYAWGAGDSGRLGLGEDDEIEEEGTTTPTRVGRDIFRSRVALVACGGRHTCAVTACGGLWSWGDGFVGALGHGDLEVRNQPTQVAAVHFDHEPVVFVACGFLHTAALTQQGLLFTFGDGTQGMLGHNDMKARAVPTRVAPFRFGGAPVCTVACGMNHTAAISRGGKLWTWGDGAAGKLGHGPAFGKVRKRDTVWLAFEKKLVPTQIIDPAAGGPARGGIGMGRGVGASRKRWVGDGKCRSARSSAGSEECDVGKGGGGGVASAGGCDAVATAGGHGDMRACCGALGRGAVAGGAGGHGKVGAGRARGREGAQKAGGREVVAGAGSASAPFSSVACGMY
jgi:alpha-tubulin suppressor-like RCC1 family protein